MKKIFGFNNIILIIIIIGLFYTYTKIQEQNIKLQEQQNTIKKQQNEIERLITDVQQLNRKNNMGVNVFPLLPRLSPNYP